MNTNILVIDGSGPCSKAQRSPARLHLADLIRQKTEAEGRLGALADQIVKLNEAADSEANARAALRVVDTEQTSAMAAWSRNSSEPKPVFDRARKDKLRAALDDAIAMATAARQAAAAVASEQQREAFEFARIVDQIDLAIVPIIAEQIEPLLAEYAVINRALAEKAGEIIGGAELINMIGVRRAGILSDKPNLEAGRPALVAHEQIAARIKAAFDRPAAVPNKTAWSDLAERLAVDALAELQS